MCKQVWAILCLLLCVGAANAQIRKPRINTDELLKQADAAYKAGEYKKGISICRQALEKMPNDNDFQFALGRLYYAVRSYDSARMLFKTVLVENPNYREVYVYLINIEVNSKRYEEALCYADDALYQFPTDQELALKKMSILHMLGYSQYADKWTDKLLSDFPRDTVVLRKYIDTKVELGQQYLKQGNYLRARYEFEKVLEQDPSNKEVLDAIYNIEIRTGNYEQGLAYINGALEKQPNSYEYLLRKEGMLEEMKRYPEAIDVLQKMIKLFPGDSKLQRINIDLHMAAGRYYLNTDPYTQFQAVLEKAPSDREALNYVINIASSRNNNEEALQWVNKALKYYSSDRGFLLKKLSLLQSLQRYTQAADLAEKMWRQNPNTAGNLQQFVDLRIMSGRAFMNDQQDDSALMEFKKVLNVNPQNVAALNYSINILTNRKNYDSANAVVDRALQYYPDNEAFLLRKSAILQDDGRFTEAAEVSGRLMQLYPQNKRYQITYVDQLVSNGRTMMQADDYDAARETFRKVLAVDPRNMDALNNMANLESGSLRYDSALYYVDEALKITPGSKDQLLKKASILNSMKRYQEAYAITGMLKDRYPYNNKIRDSYIENVLAAGRAYNVANQPDSALAEFGKVLAIAPKDSNALAYSINILNEKQQYDSALVLINRGMQYYPNSEYFVLKRAVVLENKKDYTAAALAADSAAHMNPAKNGDYAAYLKSKQYKNQIGLFFLNSTFDSGGFRTHANIATVQYARFIKRGSIAGRLNFAGRGNGTGLQLEVESEYAHNKDWRSFVNLGVANKVVFPAYKAAYSIFRTFKHGWEGELGGRYLNFDTVSTASVVGSVGKYYGDFWVNLRGYLIFQQGSQYQSVVLSARQYFDKDEFIFASLGTGNSPDDFSRNFQLAKNLGSKTYSIGAGYQKTFRYRNTLSLSGNWYNQKLTTQYRNQYDVYLSFLRKF
ncbi:tetratricopeptide repeat protein [Deminuibacter soli]|nr:tetratricopeptide repeat protein [Deminuibacter soli]